MINFKCKSLKEKLLLVILATSGICVTFTTIAITTFGILNIRHKMADDLALTAALKAGRIATYVDIGNEDNIRKVNEILTLSSTDEERIVCVYADRFGQLGSGEYEKFTKVVPGKKKDLNCPPVKDIIENEKMTKFEDNVLKTYQPIANKSSKFGFIYIETNLNEIEKFIKEQVITALLIIITVFIISYFLAHILQRAISEPIMKLVETTRRVSNERDYSIRAENFLEGEDIKKNEISSLIDAFNNMLNEVEERRHLLLRKNQELVKSKEIAESANRAKSQFLANISHELRTPLNAVIGFSDIIYKEMLGPIENRKYVEYSKDINESGEHLLHIINDILDLSKAEAGKLEPVLREIGVKKSVEECIAFISRRAEENGILIETDIPDNLPNMVADRIMFKRIISNLLSNSLKFSNVGGKIKISASSRPGNRNENIFTISIEDTGIGMGKDDIDLAFKSFVQLDGGLNRKYEGTGLGLPLTKKLVELHGGSIDLTSKVGEGTKVTIKFYSAAVV